MPQYESGWPARPRMMKRTASGSVLDLDLATRLATRLTPRIIHSIDTSTMAGALVDDALER